MIETLPRFSIALIALGTSACGVLGPSAPPTTQPIGSNACGGFHLTVVNETGERVTVTVNGQDAGAIEPAKSLTLVQWLPPQLPVMPWTVVVGRASDGTQLGTQRFESGMANQRLVVAADAIAGTPLGACIGR